MSSPTASPGIDATITFLPGLTPLEHPGFPGLVFLVDARRWTDDFRPDGSATDPNRFLHYNKIPACRLSAIPVTTLSSPNQIEALSMRGRVFHIFRYTGYDLYETGRVYFKLENAGNLECHTALETLLADVVDADVFSGRTTVTPSATRSLATPGGFTCEALSPHLLPGDTAYIGNSGVWLRSSPELGPNNTLKLFPKHAPVLVSILAGPQCASGYAYWQVAVNPVGGGGSSYSGWMAESNALTYVLFNWNP
jgi:hypothetical protein